MLLPGEEGFVGVVPHHFGLGDLVQSCRLLEETNKIGDPIGPSEPVTGFSDFLSRYLRQTFLLSEKSWNVLVMVEMSSLEIRLLWFLAMVPNMTASS